MVFSNPVVGGSGTLIRQAIKSPDYSPGSAGWSINRDGTAEFNNLSIRGTFNGTDFVINSNGAFFYSGTPAAGNLIGSIAAAAGTDTHGNHYLAGITSQAASEFVNLGGGQLLTGPVLGGAPDTADAGSLVWTDTGTVQYTSLVSTINRRDALATDAVAILMQSGRPSLGQGGSGQGNPGIIVIDEAASSAAFAQISGSWVKCSQDGNSSFIWHTPTAATNWSMTSLQYRQDCEDNVVWIGEVDFTGTSITGASAQTICSAVPTNYRPKALQRVAAAHYTSSSVLKNTAVVFQFNTDGTVQLQWSDPVGTAHDTVAMANGDKMYVCAQLPLGNIT